MKKVILCAVLAVLVTTNTSLADLMDGLAAHYTFDGDASDSSGNANHGTVYGAQLTADRFGRADQAYLFDGLDDTIEAPHSATLDITGPITLSCWVKAQDTYWRSGLIIKAPDHEPVLGYFLRTVYDKADMQLTITVGGTRDGGSVASDLLVSDNMWHLVTSTYDGLEMRMYVDGRLEASTLYSRGIGSNAAALQIGHYYYPYSDLWGPGHEGRNDVTLNGAIDDVRIYNRALTAAEAQELSVVPVPSAVLLGGIGLSLGGWLAKRKKCMA